MLRIFFFLGLKLRIKPFKNTERAMRELHCHSCIMSVLSHRVQPPFFESGTQTEGQFLSLRCVR